MELIIASLLIAILSASILTFIFIVSDVHIDMASIWLIGVLIGLSFMFGNTLSKVDSSHHDTILIMRLENNNQDTLLQSKTQYLEIYDGELYDINNDLRMGPVKVLRNSIVVGSDTIQYTKERN